MLFFHSKKLKFSGQKTTTAWIMKTQKVNFTEEKKIGICRNQIIYFKDWHLTFSNNTKRELLKK